MGHLKRICKDVFRVASAAQETHEFEMFGGPSADISDGVHLENQVFRFAKVVLRDRCRTLYDLASLFPGRRGTLSRRSGKIAKRIFTGLQLCTRLSNL